MPANPVAAKPCAYCGMTYTVCWAKQQGGKKCCHNCNHPTS